MTPARSLRIALVVSVIATGGVLASLARGDDPPTTASFTTVDGVNQFHLTAGSGTATSASIVTGGTVSFANDSVEAHDVDFTAQPGLSCTQTSGGTSSSATSFPSAPKDGQWAGTCTFARAGTYSFFCDVHAGMTGTVVVADPGAGATPPVTTAPVTPPVTSTPVATTPVATTPAQPVATTPTTTTPVTPPVAAQAAPQTTVRTLAFAVALTQRGARVRGSLRGATAGGRVRIALTAHLAARTTAVGSLAARAGAGGGLRFSVPLTRPAQRALAQRRALTVTARVTTLGATGAPISKTFRVVLRRTTAG